MSFTLPDLVIESVLREGFADLQANPDKIDDIFSSLLGAHLSTKYGQTELTKIKTQLAKDVAFVHSFNEVEAKVPAVSIQLLQDREANKKVFLDDYYGDTEEPIADIVDITIVPEFIPTSYDSISQTIYVSDLVDLTNVYVGCVFSDADDVDFEIIGGIDNTAGQKQFQITATTTPDISDVCLILSNLTTTVTELSGLISDVEIILGVHTKNPLMTKYLYYLVKYFLLSRKTDLVNRNFINFTYSGSDFTKNMEYAADMIYTRFLTISGQIEDSWNDQIVPQIGVIDVELDYIDVEIE